VGWGLHSVVGGPWGLLTRMFAIDLVAIDAF
jgi:hypothetical protein